MTDMSPKHRIVPCPRAEHPHGVMIETFGPVAPGALIKALNKAPLEAWPAEWTHVSWHESLEAAKAAVLGYIASERKEIEKHRARLAAWADTTQFAAIMSEDDDVWTADTLMQCIVLHDEVSKRGDTIFG